MIFLDEITVRTFHIYMGMQACKGRFLQVEGIAVSEAFEVRKA